VLSTQKKLSFEQERADKVKQTVRSSQNARAESLVVKKGSLPAIVEASEPSTTRPPATITTWTSLPDLYGGPVQAFPGMPVSSDLLLGKPGANRIPSSRR
jgi:hypothetical protein